ncbi:MAG: DUF3631 domain-containing protein [Corynebacterium sp.]|uniref:DUF3631 domain-containing protein n=1 Tax=Corynebacterium sp. TaxID=1720 RepID=UPI0026DBFB90|nr:DUF3631 domain-containing protein [Corynebacterium sp.]MDO5030419.1 DUF3631 domain-containing protein [Corynebacterium sp.]
MTAKSISEHLDNLADWFAKYMVFPNKHVAPMLALWTAHTYLAEQFYTTPRLVASSPAPQSGKTRLIELLELVAYRPCMSANMTPAALFRMISSQSGEGGTPPTVILDEVDTIFGAQATSSSEELRGLLNAGYKRGARVYRCTGEGSNMSVAPFECYAPVALAGIAGNLPDTIATRSIIVNLKRRRKGEKIASYRERTAMSEIKDTKTAIAEWCNANRKNIGIPTMPEGVEDRPAETWEPLLAIADMAEGHWPETARNACKHFVFDTKLERPTLEIQLLEDVREVFVQHEVKQMPTAELVMKLRSLDSAPWSTIGKDGLTAYSLSRFLSQFDVKPVQYKDSTKQKKRGYIFGATSKQAGLEDAFDRYLPALSGKSGTSGTSGTSQVKAGENGTALASSTGTDSGTKTSKPQQEEPTLDFTVPA